MLQDKHFHSINYIRYTLNFLCKYDALYQFTHNYNSLPFVCKFAHSNILEPFVDSIFCVPFDHLVLRSYKM